MSLIKRQVRCDQSQTCTDLHDHVKMQIALVPFMTCPGCGCRKAGKEDEIFSDLGHHGKFSKCRTEEAMRLLQEIAEEYASKKTPEAKKKVQELKDKYHFVPVKNGLWGFDTFGEPLLDLYQTFAPDVLHSFDLGVWQWMVKAFAVKAGPGKKAAYMRQMTARYSALRDGAR